MIPNRSLFVCCVPILNIFSCSIFYKNKNLANEIKQDIDALVKEVSKRKIGKLQELEEIKQKSSEIQEKFKGFSKKSKYLPEAEKYFNRKNGRLENFYKKKKLNFYVLKGIEELTGIADENLKNKDFDINKETENLRKRIEGNLEELKKLKVETTKTEEKYNKLIGLISKIPKKRPKTPPKGHAAAAEPKKAEVPKATVVVAEEISPKAGKTPQNERAPIAAPKAAAREVPKAVTDKLTEAISKKSLLEEKRQEIINDIAAFSTQVQAYLKNKTDSKRGEIHLLAKQIHDKFQKLQELEDPDIEKLISPYEKILDILRSEDLLEEQMQRRVQQRVVPPVAAFAPVEQPKAAPIVAPALVKPPKAAPIVAPAPVKQPKTASRFEQIRNQFVLAGTQGSRFLEDLEVLFEHNSFLYNLQDGEGVKVHKPFYSSKFSYDLFKHAGKYYFVEKVRDDLAGSGTFKDVKRRYRDYVVLLPKRKKGESFRPYGTKEWRAEISGAQLINQTKSDHLSRAIPIRYKKNVGEVRQRGLFLAKCEERTKLYQEVARGSLWDRLRGNQIGEKQKLKIALDVAKGVQALHQKGLVHRDLKPENVLIYDTGAAPVAKLSDFGSIVNTTNCTKVLDVAGTNQYLAPEGFFPKKLSLLHLKEIDCFALAMTIHEITFKKGRDLLPMINPLEHVTCYEDKKSILEANIRKHYGNRNDLLANLIKRGLSSDPSKRPTADEFVRVLTNLQQ